MPLPEPTKKHVESVLILFCKQRIPVHASDKVRLTFDTRGNSVTLYEERPQFADPSRWTKMQIAQFRFDPKSKEWSLYFKHRDEHWHEYIPNIHSKNFQDLVDEVDADPTGIFWG